MANYSFFVAKGIPLPEVENGHVFEMCNFTQLLPHTKIFEGVTGLVFRKCNLVNCDVPVDAVIDDCLRSQIGFCSNVIPKLVDYGLTQCPEVCDHVVDSDSVTIDGVLVDTIYYYENKVVI